MEQYLTRHRYQAGEGIYDLFDKVMVIDEGRQVFLGRPSEARAYFEGLGYKPLPRQSTADYLTGCTDPNERQFALGRSARDTPSSPQALENAYLLSPFARSSEDSREKYKILMETEKTDQEAFRAAVAADKKKGVSKKSPYTLGFTTQVRALTVRQFQMRLQDRFQLYTSFTLSTVSHCFVLSPSFLTYCLSGACIRRRCGFLQSTIYFCWSVHSRKVRKPGTRMVLALILIVSRLCSVIFVALLTTCLDAFAEVRCKIVLDHP